MQCFSEIYYTDLEYFFLLHQMVVIRQKGVNVCCFRIHRTIAIVAFPKLRCAKILAAKNILST